MRACIIALMTVFLVACGNPKVTRSNYNLIGVGMHYSEVTHMLGQPDWCDNFERPTECRWGSDSKYIHIDFAARRVVNTSSSGL